MKQLFFLIVLLSCVELSKAQLTIGDSLRLTVVAEGLCASLTWTDLDTVNPHLYAINVRYNNENAYNIVDTTWQHEYRYCLPRHLCGDTVYFRISRRSDDYSIINQISPYAAESFSDNKPTSGCTVDRVTVDPASQHILLSWHPSPDADIMGYYICTGHPCTDYDTVWGRTDTTYVCMDHEAHEAHEYRVLAFDSCFQASPLTPYYGNLVLEASAPECSRTATFRWNEYQNMPSGVDYYLLHVELQPIGVVLEDSVPSNDDRSVTLTLTDEVDWLRATVTAVSHDRSTKALSNETIYHFDSIETARYLNIAHIEYDFGRGAVRLNIVADTDYATDGYTLYRAADSEEFVPIAWLPFEEDGQLEYEDYGIRPMEASRYSYTIGVYDHCGLRETRSSAAVIVLPSTDSKGAFFPNIFTPSRVDNNQFCPSYRFITRDNYQLDIYNRMGMRVFESNDPSQCWDGTHNGQPMAQGVYVYQVRCRYIDGTLDEWRGTLLLLD